MNRYQKRPKPTSQDQMSFMPASSD
jgi:hypothetical protein